jgi:hypothetical protein
VIILEGRVRAKQRHCRRLVPESFILYGEESKAEIMTKQTPTDSITKRMAKKDTGRKP